MSASLRKRLESLSPSKQVVVATLIRDQVALLSGRDSILKGDRNAVEAGLVLVAQMAGFEPRKKDEVARAVRALEVFINRRGGRIGVESLADSAMALREGWQQDVLLDHPLEFAGRVELLPRDERKLFAQVYTQHNGAEQLDEELTLELNDIISTSITNT